MTTLATLSTLDLTGYAIALIVLIVVGFAVLMLVLALGARRG